MHIPVLLKEVIEYFNPSPGKNFIDATVGGGGHAKEILKKTFPDGKLLGLDASPEAIEDIKAQTKESDLKRLILINDNFSHLKEIVQENNFQPVNGVLFDLGLSSNLLASSGRGFSFMAHEFLDMRYNPQGQSLTADKIINNYDKNDLEMFFRDYGGERFAGRIAQAIVKERKNGKITMTSQLVMIIRKALGRRFHVKSLARVFQALRIKVNYEMENIQLGFNDAVDILTSGGRIIVLTYHSGEDQIVKNLFKQEPRIKIINKKTIKPSQEEIKNNIRARSAKMRVGEKI